MRGRPWGPWAQQVETKISQGPALGVRAGETGMREKQKPDLGLHMGTLGTPDHYPLEAQTKSCSNSM